MSSPLTDKNINEEGGAIDECLADNADKPKCEKCGKIFADEYSLKHHMEKRTTSCIGIWYVCRRCLQCFKSASLIKIHQQQQKLCIPPNFEEPTPHTTTAMPPPELIKSLKLRKGAYDNGTMEAYLQRVIKRRNATEMRNVLEAVNISELYLMLKLIRELPNRSGIIDCLAHISSFANMPTTSPEKHATIQEFVAEQTTM